MLSKNIRADIEIRDEDITYGKGYLKRYCHCGRLVFKNVFKKAECNLCKNLDIKYLSTKPKKGKIQIL